MNLQTIFNKNFFTRYLFTLLISVAIIILKFYIPHLGPEVPFLLDLFAVIIASMYGGLGAGIFATLVTGTLSNYVFIEESYAFDLEIEHIWQTGLYYFQGIVMSWLIDKQRRTLIRNTQLASIVEASHDAIISVNLEGKIISWNTGAEKVFGYTQQEALGRSLKTIVPKDKIKEAHSLLEQVKQNKALTSYETIRLTKNKERIWVSLTLSPLLTSTNKVIGFSAISRDITKQKELDHRKDEFISIASHELKTPLTSLKMFTQILHAQMAKKMDEKSSDILLKIDRQTNKLRDLINDLLDVTRIQAGKIQLRESKFDIDELINEVVSEMQLSTGTHKIIVNAKARKEVHADRERLSQVLVNLISNAIKYSPKADKVIIHASGTDKEVIIKVQDFGYGISKERQVKIFDKFYRIEAGKRGTYPGLGLGLFISREIIKRLRGDLWVESKPGKGSTFSITLPLGARRRATAGRS